MADEPTTDVAPGQWRRVEYGVIVDRTRNGLGYYLAKATESLPMAEMTAEAIGSEYPIEIKVRYVTRSEWRSRGAHVGGCSDRCDGDSHWLEQDYPPAATEDDDLMSHVDWTKVDRGEAHYPPASPATEGEASA